MEHVVMFSSGIGSWAAGRRIVDRHGAYDVTLLFADTNTEDADNYRFLRDAAEDLLGEVGWGSWEGCSVDGVRGLVVEYPSESGGRLVWITNDGRTIWDVFREARFLGNTRADPCSRMLKREPMRAWLESECDPGDTEVVEADGTEVVIGFGFEEAHRLDRAWGHWQPWSVSAPMTDEPLRTKDQVLGRARDRGLEPPRLYDVAGGSLPHANCGGLCVKAGQVQFELALRELPDVYAEWEGRENEMRDLLGDVSILRDRTGGTTDPLTLAEFRRRLEAQPSLFDRGDVGSCSCMTPAGEDDDGR